MIDRECGCLNFVLFRTAAKILDRFRWENGEDEEGKVMLRGLTAGELAFVSGGAGENGNDVGGTGDLSGAGEGGGGDGDLGAGGWVSDIFKGIISAGLYDGVKWAMENRPIGPTGLEDTSAQIRGYDMTGTNQPSDRN